MVALLTTKKNGLLRLLFAIKSCSKQQESVFPWIKKFKISVFPYVWRIWLVGQEPLSLKDQSDVPHEKASSQLLLLVKYQLWDLTLVTWQHALMTHVEPLVQMLSASECIISTLSSH